MTDTFDIDDIFDITDEELDTYVNFLDIDALDEEILAEDFCPDIDEEMLEEALAIFEAPLNLMQRMKRSRMMRRLAPRLKRAKKIKAKLMAKPERLVVRAAKAARNIIRKRSAGKMGENYKNLSPAQKISIDKIVERKKGQIDKMAKRLMPKVRKAEVERLKKARSSVKTESHNPADILWEAYADLDISGIEKKAERFDIAYEILEDILYEGMNAWLNSGTKLTPQQYGYASVNKYIAEKVESGGVRHDRYKKVMSNKSDQELHTHAASTNKVHQNLAKNEIRKRGVSEGASLNSTEDKQKREREQLKDRQTRERMQARARDMRSRVHREETVYETKKPKDSDPCWNEYEMVGHKKKDGKKVPNCVPKEDIVHEASALDRLKKFDKSRVAAGRPAFFDDKKKDDKKSETKKEGYAPVEWGTPDSVERYTRETPGQKDVTETPKRSSNKMVKDLMTAKYMKRRVVSNKKKYDRKKDNNKTQS